jgi:hypothetical protein
LTMKTALSGVRAILWFFIPPSLYFSNPKCKPNLQEHLWPIFHGTRKHQI